MKKLIILSCAVVCLCIISACSSSDNSNSATPIPQTISGEVLRDALDNQNADIKVFADLNGNMVADNGEPSAQADASGQYSLNYLGVGDISSAVIVAQIGSAQRAVGDSYYLSTPMGQSIISPLTTLVVKKMQEGLSFADANSAVTAETGIDTFKKQDYSTSILVASKYIASSMSKLVSDLTGETLSSEELDSLSAILLENILKTIKSTIKDIVDNNKTDVPPAESGIDDITIMLTKGAYGLSGINNGESIRGIAILGLKLKNNEIYLAEMFLQDGNTYPNGKITNVDNMVFTPIAKTTAQPNGFLLHRVDPQIFSFITQTAVDTELRNLMGDYWKNRPELSAFVRMNKKINLTSGGITVMTIEQLDFDWDSITISQVYKEAQNAGNVKPFKQWATDQHGSQVANLNNLSQYIDFVAKSHNPLWDFTYEVRKISGRDCMTKYYPTYKSSQLICDDDNGVVYTVISDDANTANNMYLFDKTNIQKVLETFFAE